jgi:hypothetical protein
MAAVQPRVTGDGAVSGAVMASAVCVLIYDTA